MTRNYRHNLRAAQRGPRARVFGAAACTAAVAAVITGTGNAAAEELPAAIPAGPCPKLLVLGVQGTGQSTPTADPTADTGMLGAVLGPTVAAHPDVARAYVPYDAGFGGLIGTGSGRLPFAESVAQAHDRLTQMATTALAQCPGTRLAIAGYSQGALAVSQLAEEIGAGAAAVAPEQVAGVALLANPAKNQTPDPLPGRPGQRTPDPAPGSGGASVAGVQLAPVPGTGGIAGTGGEYGALSGRVAEVCASGDLACDIPPNAAVVRATAGLLAGADLHDPLAAAGSLGAAWSDTVAEVTAEVVLDDISVVGGQVDYVPQQSISQRVAHAARPGVDEYGPAHEQAVADKISQVGAVIAADPLGQVPRVVGQVLAAIGQIGADNADVVNPAVLGQLFTTPLAHMGYAAQGHSEPIRAWVDALADDLSTP